MEKTMIINWQYKWNHVDMAKISEATNSKVAHTMNPHKDNQYLILAVKHFYSKHLLYFKL